MFLRFNFVLFTCQNWHLRRIWTHVIHTPKKETRHNCTAHHPHTKKGNTSLLYRTLSTHPKKETRLVKILRVWVDWSETANVSCWRTQHIDNAEDWIHTSVWLEVRLYTSSPLYSRKLEWKKRPGSFKKHNNSDKTTVSQNNVNLVLLQLWHHCQ